MIFMEGENMVISINDASEIPIYQQIRNQIVLGISDGRLAPANNFPPCGHWQRKSVSTP